jgi:hypothetical protein
MALHTADTTQLAFYASYHSNIINKAIHLVCIPLIYWWVPVDWSCCLTASRQDARWRIYEWKRMRWFRSWTGGLNHADAA